MFFVTDSFYVSNTNRNLLDSILICLFTDFRNNRKSAGILFISPFFILFLSYCNIEIFVYLMYLLRWSRYILELYALERNKYQYQIPERKYSKRVDGKWTKESIKWLMKIICYYSLDRFSSKYFNHLVGIVCVRWYRKIREFRKNKRTIKSTRKSMKEFNITCHIEFK